MRLHTIALGSMLLTFSALSSSAETTAPASDGPVILTVSTEGPQQSALLTFSLEALKSLPKTAFSTSTVWSDGVQHFEGVALSDFVDTSGLRGQTLRAFALNNYAVTIPAEDAIVGGAMIAYARNGKDMSIRDKGPLWIVYPYDANIRYADETFYSRSIWQLARIEAFDD